MQSIKKKDHLAGYLICQNYANLGRAALYRQNEYIDTSKRTSKIYERGSCRSKYINSSEFGDDSQVPSKRSRKEQKSSEKLSKVGRNSIEARSSKYTVRDSKKGFYAFIYCNGSA